MQSVMLDWSGKFGLFCLVCLLGMCAWLTARSGRMLKQARIAGIATDPVLLETHRGGVKGTAITLIGLLVALVWVRGELNFLTDFFYLPRAVLPHHTGRNPLLWAHLPIALSTLGMFAVIALRYTGLRDRLRHRKLVYVFLGLLMLSGVSGSILLALM